MSLELILITSLTLKHFLADFVLQTPYQVNNKGKLGHPGGLLHVAIHIAFTLVILVALMYLGYPIRADYVMWAIFLEAGIHYYTDFCKMNFNEHKGWKPCDPQFWWLTGFDQLVHYMTYIGIVYFIISRQY